MKNILCFGDSLTWGFNPITFSRFEYGDRWTGILQEHLGRDYRVIEEGLNSRTIISEDGFTPYQEFGVGLKILPMLLDSHAPLDLVILMLGTNDLQPHRQINAKLAARGCGDCIMQILKSAAGPQLTIPKVLLMSPPIFKQPKGYMQVSFSDDISESKQLAYYYELTANTFGTEFLDTAQHVETSEVDGIHLDKEANKVLAKAITNKVREIFEG